MCTFTSKCLPLSYHHFWDIMIGKRDQVWWVKSPPSDLPIAPPVCFLPTFVTPRPTPPSTACYAFIPSSSSRCLWLSKSVLPPPPRKSSSPAAEPSPGTQSVLRPPFQKGHCTSAAPYLALTMQKLTWKPILSIISGFTCVNITFLIRHIKPCHISLSRFFFFLPAFSSLFKIFIAWRRKYLPLGKFRMGQRERQKGGERGG